MSQWYIQFKKSGRWVINAGDTGFKSSLDWRKATGFRSLDEAQRFCISRGITWDVVITPMNIKRV